MADNPEITTKLPTRFEAQRNLGLFGAHDLVSVIFLFLSWIGWSVSLILFVDPMPWKVILGWAVVNLVVAQIWIIILVYRGLVFVLDLHAEIALMPEAAARIAAGYFEGRMKGGK